MAEMAARMRVFYSSATMEDMDKVEKIMEEVIMTQFPQYRNDPRVAGRLALNIFLLANPEKYALPKTGGNYKKHKTLKRKHRKFTNKSKKHKRTIYHRKK